MAAHPTRTMQGGTTLATTYDVRIYSIRTHTSKRGVDTFNLRWNVAGKTFCKTFKTKGLAESHRAELITAQRAGTPFDVAEGLPITILRNRRDSITWYQHAMDFIDMKWSTLEGGSRRTYAESLATVTAAMVHTKRGVPEHLETYGTTADGRIFRNSNGNSMTYASYGQVWRKAREETLTMAQARSPLGKRPYDLRHACLSTWLNAGVPATQVAEWAGHSVAMLLSTYAKCLDGQENAAMMKIESALEPVTVAENPQEPGT